jgi:hypothetical protein
MSENNIDETFDIVYYVIEPKASFISQGDDDNVRYFIPPEILEILVWIALNVSLPILSGVATSVLADRFKEKDHKVQLKALEIQKNELEHLKIEVKAALDRLDKEKLPSKEQAHIAQASLAQVLRINGWPLDIAETDAEITVVKLREQLWKEKL